MTKIYITTAIPYVNGAPHIGHALDYILADTYRRFLLSQGNKVRLQAGTDEHGNKVFQKAAEAGIPVQQFTDQNADKFKDFIHALSVEYTDFIRTTSPDHIRRCQSIWQKLEKHIYKGAYEGWYCEGCEGFTTEAEHEANNGICPDHNKPYIRLSEENYYLRIADFKDRIKKAIDSDEMRIVPAFRKKEFLNLLKDMPDVSISRPKKQLSWGVPVPSDDDQVMYVWLDALANYITVLGYPDQDISDWWPADTQIIGKDILRFHAGIWPTILLGLELPLPKNILTHGHITVDGAKMSKSIGNVVNPIEVLDKYGVEPFRYFFLRHVPTTDDADFSWDKYDSAYNELANDLGNLVQRLSAMISKYEITNDDNLDVNSIKQNILGKNLYDNHMTNFQFSDAFNLAWRNVQDINKAIDDKKPWALAKEGKLDELSSELKLLQLQMLEVALLLEPFLPDTSQKIINIFSSKTVIPPASPLFPKS